MLFSPRLNKDGVPIHVMTYLENITFIQRLYKNIHQDIFVYIILSVPRVVSFYTLPNNIHPFFSSSFNFISIIQPILIEFQDFVFSDAVKTLVLNNLSWAKDK